VIVKRGAFKSKWEILCQNIVTRRSLGRGKQRSWYVLRGGFRKTTTSRKTIPHSATLIFEQRGEDRYLTELEKISPWHRKVVQSMHEEVIGKIGLSRKKRLRAHVFKTKRESQNHAMAQNGKMRIARLVYAQTGELTLGHRGLGYLDQGGKG